MAIGYVGLPLAVAIVEQGHDIAGVAVTFSVSTSTCSTIAISY